MNIQDHINKGVIQDYCLGLLTSEERAIFEKELDLYPALRAEVDMIENSLESYILSYQIAPKPLLKERIWATLENINLEKQMDLNKLPLLNKYFNPEAWAEAVKPLLPNTIGKETFMHVLTQTESVMQVLVMSGIDIPDEVHDDVIESFIILEGECECYIGNNKVVKLRAGEFIEIPMHEHHDVKIVSSYVVGVMQRVAA